MTAWPRRARFKEVSGWKARTWYGTPGTKPRARRLTGPAEWSSAGSQSIRAARRNVILMDMVHGEILVRGAMPGLLPPPHFRQQCRRRAGVSHIHSGLNRRHA